MLPVKWQTKFNSTSQRLFQLICLILIDLKDCLIIAFERSFSNIFFGNAGVAWCGYFVCIDCL